MFVEPGGYGGAANGAARGGGKPLPHISATAKRVFNQLQSAPQNNEGLHVQMIASQLGLPTNDVFKACDELLGLGIIYTTVDDETWVVLDFRNLEGWLLGAYMAFTGPSYGTVCVCLASQVIYENILNELALKQTKYQFR